MPIHEEVCPSKRSLRLIHQTELFENEQELVLRPISTASGISEVLH